VPELACKAEDQMIHSSNSDGSMRIKQGDTTPACQLARTQCSMIGQPLLHHPAVKYAIQVPAGRITLHYTATYAQPLLQSNFMFSSQSNTCYRTPPHLDQSPGTEVVSKPSSRWPSDGGATASRLPSITSSSSSARTSDGLDAGSAGRTYIDINQHHS
jgi:hypothetical protein